MIVATSQKVIGLSRLEWIHRAGIEMFFILIGPGFFFR